MESKDDLSDDFAMYIFVNNDLKMQKGKIAGQVGHVVQIITEEIIIKSMESTKHNIPDCCIRYDKWKHGAAKIILKATEKELLELKNMDESRYVLDAGKTQISPNSLTVVGFFPNHKKRMYELTKKFKLL
jgi:PTH2 family peptidyl-tRNA hydrolase